MLHLKAAMRQTNHQTSQALPPLITLAHELKNPLTLVRQLAVTAEQYDERQMQQALHRISLTSGRALRLVEAISRTYAAQNISGEPIQLKRLCEEVAHELSPLAQAKQQELRIVMPAKPLMAVGDRDIVSSVVFGLCDNALSYDTSRQPIVIQANQVASNIRIGVNDHASEPIKIARSDIGAEPVLSQSANCGGSGLGLYIASQFALKMQGSINFQRHRTGGHLFYLDLPRSTQLSFV